MHAIDHVCNSNTSRQTFESTPDGLMIGLDSTPCNTQDLLIKQNKPSTNAQPTSFLPPSTSLEPLLVECNLQRV